MRSESHLDYHIRQYALQQGALEIEYIEEYVGEYQRRKLASEVVDWLVDRDHQILMAEAPLPDDPSTVVPVAYKVSHELRFNETEHPTRVPSRKRQQESCAPRRETARG